MTLSANQNNNDPAASRPNGATYWVNPCLLAGEYPAHRSGNLEETKRKLQSYLDHGITHFIDLTHEGEKSEYDSILSELGQQKVQYKRWPIRDFGIPTKERMTEILEEIDRALGESNSSNERQPNKVYVHCRGGIGRTGTVVGCYLARNSKISGNSALETVNRLFQQSTRSLESDVSPETRDQMDFVRNWKEE